MRWLKWLVFAVLVAVAVTFGFMLLVALVVGMLAFYLGRTLLRRLRGAPASAGHAMPRPRPAPAGNVIDITATEVGREPRLR